MATPSVMPQTATQPMDDNAYAERIRQALVSAYGADDPRIESQVQYFLGKRHSGETSSWATGDPGRTMDDYWVARASGMGAGGADAAKYGQWAGGDAPAPGMSGGFSNQPVNGVASFNAPGLLAPYTNEFTGPDPMKTLESPVVQARMRLGEDAIQRSAAAKGTLLTGGTLKDLNSFAQDVASQEYNNDWNRAYQGAGFNRDSFWGNQNNAFNRLSGFANTGLNGAQTLGTYGAGYANNVGDLYTGQANVNASATGANAVNKNQTLGNLAQNVGSVDWSKLFKRKPSAGTPGSDGTPGVGGPGAALPGTY